MMPVTHDVDQLNQIGRRLVQLKKLQSQYLSRMQNIGTEMRENYDIIYEVIEHKLKIIRTLIQEPSVNRDFQAAQVQFQKCLISVKANQLESFKALLDARNTCLEQGREMPLTKEKKIELLAYFATIIDKQFAQIVFGIDPTTDLATVETTCVQQLEELFVFYENLMECKTQLTREQYNLAELAHNIKESRDAEFINTSGDIWRICESGDLDTLMQQPVQQMNVQNKQGCTPLALASANGHLSCVTFLLSKKADTSIADASGYQPLHWAAKKNHLEVAQALVAHKAPLNALGEYGRTPLHMAAHNGCVPVLKFLIEKGANPNIRTTIDDNSMTPLLEAIMQEHKFIVDCLIRVKDLDVNIADASNHAPLYYAVLMGRSEFVALIMGHMSWKCPKNVDDPNHIKQLLKLKLTKNSEQIKRYLENIVFDS